MSHSRGDQRLRAGRLAAEMLQGCWRRPSPPPSVAPDRMPEAVPVLVGTRAAGLLWPSLAASGGLGEWPGTAHLRDAYAGNALAYARREGELEALFTSLDAAGIEAVVIKGWDVARRYPGRGQRSVGDIDLCVAPADRDRARSVAADLDVHPLDVRHVLMSHMAGQEQGVLARRTVVQVGSTAVGVPSNEDTLRLSCLHVLQHGANWPHMLCDVALLAEAEGCRLDWDRVGGPGEPEAGWVLAVLTLARDLLGADVSTSPAADGRPWRAKSVDGLCRRWGAAPLPRGHDRTTDPLRGLRSGWTDPISAAFRIGRPADGPWPATLTLRHYLRQHLAGARSRLRSE